MNKFIFLCFFLLFKLNAFAQFENLQDANYGVCLNAKAKENSLKIANHISSDYAKKIGHIGANFIVLNANNSNKNLNNALGFSLKLGWNVLEKVNIPLSIYWGVGLDYLFINSKKTNYPGFKTDLVSDAANGIMYADFDLDFSKDDDSNPIVLFGNTFCGFRNYTDNLSINFSDTSKKGNVTKIIAEKSFIYGYGGGIKFLNLSKGADKFGINLSLEFKYQKYFGNSLKAVDVNSLIFDNTGHLQSYKVIDSDFNYDLFTVGLFIGFERD
jgi:hypothetical protein